ncbi:SRPBCC domain-containing protein [Chitinophaga qingshengii]|uniref:SRPBCC domain-containing protein n=1 Tax=Chitinophaga qingshengii TaxID=1569794 RepID=A0ABR7TFN7_9BACT|nr:SRPBCC domain-containing protein [Chitinophaga qingshengii]MBC9929181.1 SRPBCC domain-containing protein [Chitinophaga qingshengii]
MANSNSQDTFISRIINAPQELVFEAWTSEEHLQHWYAPKGCTVHFAQVDIRPGGGFLSCIRNPTGNYKDCWCKTTFLEITRPEKIVCTLQVADANGNLLTSREAGMDPDWPDQTTLTVTFTPQGDKTLFTLHQTVSTVLAKRTGAEPSWLQMLDILEEHLQPAGAR